MLVFLGKIAYICVFVSEKMCMEVRVYEAYYRGFSVHCCYNSTVCWSLHVDLGCLNDVYVAKLIMYKSDQWVSKYVLWCLTDQGFCNPENISDWKPQIWIWDWLYSEK